MTVAAYIEPLPEGWPKRSTIPCRDCADYKHQRCPGCVGTGEERTEDWGPYHSSSWTAGTMDATLRALGFRDGSDSLSTLGVLLDAYCKLYGGGILEVAVHYAQGGGTPCGRELLRWALALAATHGVPLSTHIYVA